MTGQGMKQVHVWLPEAGYEGLRAALKVSLSQRGLPAVWHETFDALQSVLARGRAGAAVVPWAQREIGAGRLPVVAVVREGQRAPYDGRPHFWVPAGAGRSGHGLVRAAERIRALLAAEEGGGWWLWQGHIGLHPEQALLWIKDEGETWGKVSVLRPLTARLAARLWRQQRIPAEMLYREIWGESDLRDRRVLDVHLSWLRRALGECGTLKSVGGIVTLEVRGQHHEAVPTTVEHYQAPSMLTAELAR